MNLQVWNKLPKDIQTMLEQCAKESEEFVWQAANKSQKKSAGILKEKGMTVYTPTPADLEQFYKISLPVMQNWVKKQGETADKILKSLEKVK